MTPERKDAGTQASSEINDGLIVHELLAFTTHRINSMPYDMILKLLHDFYTDEVVEEAKSVLRHAAFKHTDPPRSLTLKRKGKDRKTHNIQDILNALLELDVHSYPCFVAKDLNNLPPLSMNCFDISTLLRSIEDLNIKVSVLQSSYESLTKTSNAIAGQLCNVGESNASLTLTSQETEDCQQESPPNDASQQSIATSDELQADSSADQTQQPDAETSDNLPRRASSSPLNDASRQSIATSGELQADPSADPTPQPDAETSNSRATASQSSVPDNALFTEVVRRPAVNRHHSAARGNIRQYPNTQHRNQLHIIQGKGNDSSLRAARRDLKTTQRPRRCVGVFVSRLARSSRPKEVAAHVKRETGLSIRCEELQTKHDSYRSFCLRAPQKDITTLLNPFLWPNGSIVRKFFDN